MNHGSNRLYLEGLAQCRLVAQISLDQGSPADRRPVPGPKIVHYYGEKARASQHLRTVTSNVTGPTSDENRYPVLRFTHSLVLSHPYLGGSEPE